MAAGYHRVREQFVGLNTKHKEQLMMRKFFTLYYTTQSFFLRLLGENTYASVVAQTPSVFLGRGGDVDKKEKGEN